MLQKLRSRGAIDLPYAGFGRKKAILAILGGLFVVFVLIPLLLSPLAALLRESSRVAVAIAAGFGALLLALLVGYAVGKKGWERS